MACVLADSKSSQVSNEDLHAQTHLGEDVLELLRVGMEAEMSQSSLSGQRTRKEGYNAPQERKGKD